MCEIATWWNTSTWHTLAFSAAAAAYQKRRETCRFSQGMHEACPGPTHRPRGMRSSDRAAVSSGLLLFASRPRAWLLVVAFAVSLVAGCRTPPRYVGPTGARSGRGALIGVEHLKSYSALHLRILRMLARLPAHIPVDNGVDTYRVTYWTEHLGHAEIASGLLALPAGREARGVVTWLGGTNPTRMEAPAESAPYAALIAAAFAGNGFTLLAPDYVGLGLSRTYHPYFYEPTTVTSVIDMIRAARVATEGMGGRWDSRVYVIGFSEGAFAATAVHRSLESTPEPFVDLVESVGIGAPLDLADVAVPYALEGHSTASSMYLAYLVHAYSRVYAKPLTDLLRPDFATLVPALFDGEHDVDAIEAALPRDPRTMFNQDALAAFRPEASSWFRDALRANAHTDWSPRAPLRLYYGDSDIDVPAEATIRGARRMREHGGNVEWIDAGPYGHNEVMFRTVPRAVAWFKELGR